MPQRLDEGPLTIDALVQQFLGERTRALHGRIPSASHHLPRPPEPVGICGPQQTAVGVATVQLGLDQWADVHTVDRHLVDVAVDLDSLQPSTADDRVPEVDVVEARPAEVDLLEAAVAPVLHASDRSAGTGPVTNRTRRAARYVARTAPRSLRSSVLAALRGLELLPNNIGNAAPCRHVDAVGLRPRPNSCRVRRHPLAHRFSRSAPPATHPTTCLNEWTDRLLEFGEVLLREVELVRVALVPDRDGVGSFRTIHVVDQGRDDFLRHLVCAPVLGSLIAAV